MPTLRIDVSKELHQRLKFRAIREGIPLKELLPRLLEVALRKEREKEKEEISKILSTEEPEKPSP